MPDLRPVIYLAGPLFTVAERRWNLDLANALRAHGLRVFLPQEEATRRASGKAHDARDRFEMSIELIGRCDAVVAVLDGPDIDSGTAFECGVAWKAGKPIVGLRTDPRVVGGLGQPVNLMLSQACASLVEVPQVENSTPDSIARLIVGATDSILGSEFRNR
jgi:nucleoside 2-deoxyribosyltransferase